MTISVPSIRSLALVIAALALLFCVVAPGPADAAKRKTKRVNIAMPSMGDASVGFVKVKTRKAPKIRVGNRAQLPASATVLGGVGRARGKPKAYLVPYVVINRAPALPRAFRRTLFPAPAGPAQAAGPVALLLQVAKGATLKKKGAHNILSDAAARRTLNTICSSLGPAFRRLRNAPLAGSLSDGALVARVRSAAAAGDCDRLLDELLGEAQPPAGGGGGGAGGGGAGGGGAGGGGEAGGSGCPGPSSKPVAQTAQLPKQGRGEPESSYRQRCFPYRVKMDVRRMFGGSILLAGSTSPSNGDIQMLRLDDNGEVDTAFGTNGVRTTAIDLVANGHDVANALAVAPDGKYVLAGFATGMFGRTDIAVVRYNSDGSPDSTFDGDGVKTLNIGDFDRAYDVAVQSDGKIVVGGESGNAPPAWTVIRLEPDGDPDATFGGGDGIVTTPLGSSTFAGERVKALKLLSGGKILAGGTVDGNSGAGANIALAQYEPDGDLDTASFGSGTGIVQTSLPGQEELERIELDASGRIVAAGAVNNLNGTIDFLVARYGADGTPDNSFDGNGNRAVAFQVMPFALLSGLAIDGDKILLGGSAFVSNTDADFALASLNSDGSFDTSFAGDGRATYPVLGNDFAASLLIKEVPGGPRRAILGGTCLIDNEPQPCTMAVSL